MVKGIHHISMKCNIGEIDRVKDFYINVLGMSICREWPEGIMIDSGNGLIEVFVTGNGEHRKGSIRHIAFATEDVDNVIDKVKKAGYEVFIEPNDKVINSASELVEYCEKYGGQIPRFNLDEPLDKVDEVIKDLKLYNKTLIYEDPALSREI